IRGELRESTWGLPYCPFVDPELSRVFLGRYSYCPSQSHPHDPASDHLLDTENTIFEFNLFPLFHQVSGFCEEESGKGDVLSCLWNIQRKPLVQLAYRDTGVDADGTVDVSPHQIHFNIVLILNFTDDLLDQILEGPDTFNSAMLVHDDSKMGLRVLQQTHSVVQPCRVRDEHRLSQQLRQPERLRIVQVGHQVLAVQNPYDVV